MSIIQTTNHGPLILASSFWGSEYDKAGKIHCSCNAGCVRVLIPQSLWSMLDEMRASKEVILSRGPSPRMALAEAIEILFEDNSGSPFALHLGTTSFDILPAEPEPGREWTLSVWVAKKGKPHCALTRICHWRRVQEIPCMKPWGD